MDMQIAKQHLPLLHKRPDSFVGKGLCLWLERWWGQGWIVELGRSGQSQHNDDCEKEKREVADKLHQFLCFMSASYR